MSRSWQTRNAVVWDVLVEVAAQESTVGKVDLDLLHQPPLSGDAIEVADEERRLLRFRTRCFVGKSRGPGLEARPPGRCQPSLGVPRCYLGGGGTRQDTGLDWLPEASTA
jgi:hypothetical protein